MKWLKRVLLVVLAAVFLFSSGIILYKWVLDHRTAKEYAETAKRFASAAQLDAEREEGMTVPLQVDFEALREVNEDVVGWIYCEGTALNYPVLHGESNDTYLRHLYDGSYSVAGSIFIEAENRPDLTDANTILYGHYMQDETMFGGLSNWKDQAYYKEHPVLWLLTPAQDYRIDIMASYYTSAYSEAYLLFEEHNAAFEEYLAAALSRSEIATDVQAEPDAQYVLLSTCASVSGNDERFVVHGKLVPVNTHGR